MSSIAVSTGIKAFTEFCKYSDMKIIKEIDVTTLKNIKKHGSGNEFEDYLYGSDLTKSELREKYYYGVPDMKEVMENYYEKKLK